MDENTNYYELLEVDPSADDNEIRKAYFRKIRQYSNETHPEEFQLITKAYKTLSNPEKRSEYDRESRDNGQYEQLMSQGMEAAGRENFDEAIRIFNQVLSLYPEDTGALFQKAYALIEQEKYPQAKTIVSKLLREEAGNPDILELGVITNTRTGDFHQAVILCEQLIKKNPEETNYYMHLSNIYYEQDQPEKSIQSLERRLGMGETIHEYALLKELFYLTMIVQNDGYHRRVIDRLRNLPRSDDEREMLIEWLINECSNIQSTHPAYPEYVQIIKRLNIGRNVHVNTWLTHAENKMNEDQYQQPARQAYQQSAASYAPAQTRHNGDGTGSLLVAVIVGIIFSFIFTPIGGIIAGFIYYFNARFIWRAIGVIIAIIVVLFIIAAGSGAFG